MTLHPESAVIGAVAVTVVYFGLDTALVILKRINRHLRARLRARTEAAMPSVSLPWPMGEPEASTTPHGWFSLPGGMRLEYRDTGFYIEFRPTKREHPYYLYTPEGGLIAWGGSLQAVKARGAIAATEREEFASWYKGHQP